MENDSVLNEKELGSVTGGIQIVNDNRCPKCHSVAYILLKVEAGGIEYRKCTCCKTDYGVKKY